MSHLVYITEPLEIAINESDMLLIAAQGFTVEAGMDAGKLWVDDLRLDDRPFPRRGSALTPFERELRQRIIDAIVKTKRHLISREFARHTPAASAPRQEL